MNRTPDLLTWSQTPYVYLIQRSLIIIFPETAYFIKLHQLFKGASYFHSYEILVKTPENNLFEVVIFEKESRK